MKNRIGSNQHKTKYRVLKPETWASIWMVAFFTLLLSVLTRQTIISPCPADGCFVRTVYAKESLPIPTIKEQVALAGLREFGINQVDSFLALIKKESDFKPSAINPTSGACGLGQANPCKKMKCSLDDATCQIDWVVKYVKSRYGTPNNAWAFHLEKGWY